LTSENEPVPAGERWLNATTLGVGLTSLLSDWSHETATAVLPAFLTSLGAGPGWLGAIEGTADGLSALTKLIAGHLTDRLPRRKPLVVAGYAVTAAATGALAAATNVVATLLLRVTAWLGRGARTPGRKALLAAAVPEQAYGRAFGFERMMDTLGAVLGPLTALWLLARTHSDYPLVFLWCLLPGILAMLAFALLVRERPLVRQSRSLLIGVRALPRPYRRFLLAVGIFGLGDFSPTLLILYATQKLTPAEGAAHAAQLGMTLYLLRNVLYATFAYAGGWLGDRLGNRRALLAAAYLIAAGMAALLWSGSARLGLLATIFVIAGMFTGMQEALEDSVAAELVPAEQHGLAFGTLAAVNAVGDFASSALVGLLWTSLAPQLAFAVAGMLFVAGAALLLRG
jgi:MFS family permease